MSTPHVYLSLGSDLSDDEQDMDVYESFNLVTEPSEGVLRKLAASAPVEYEYPDDELVNHEDPYLQGLLGPLSGR